MAAELKKEDYVEPRCLLCETPYGVQEEVKAVPQQRIIEKMDEYMAVQDYKGAERHLKYWLEEAILGHDKKGELMIRNELVGHFRKTGNKPEFLENEEKINEILKSLEFENSLSAATSYVNIATALNSFSENEKALPYFIKAKDIYESSNFVRPNLKAGLYNNMGLSYSDLKMYKEALESYEKALDTISSEKGNELEVAITYLNMANTYEYMLGYEEAENTVFDLLEKAYECFNSENVERNGYYAYVCDKSYQTFSYYGYFLYAEELKRRRDEIYARS